MLGRVNECTARLLIIGRACIASSCIWHSHAAVRSGASAAVYRCSHCADSFLSIRLIIAALHTKCRTAAAVHDQAAARPRKMISDRHRRSLSRLSSCYQQQLPHPRLAHTPPFRKLTFSISLPPKSPSAAVHQLPLPCPDHCAQPSPQQTTCRKRTQHQHNRCHSHSPHKSIPPSTHRH